ncbi:MAG: 4Fe-4S binding protein [Thermoproteota archaeon]
MTDQQKNWKEIPPAGICWKPSTEYLTGDWKTYRPVRDPDKCTKCMLCVMFCPEGAILWKEGSIEIEYDFCKGCGICANECPTDAIEMELE